MPMLMHFYTVYAAEAFQVWHKVQVALRRDDILRLESNPLSR